MIKRRASAQWQGTGQEGSGSLTSPSGVLSSTPYSFNTRFGEGVTGTNPEELLGAAHAGCFTMAVAFALQQGGFKANELNTEAVVTLEPGNGGFSVSGVKLILSGSADGVDAAKFKEIAEGAKANCPISRALSVPVELEIK